MEVDLNSFRKILGSCRSMMESVGKFGLGLGGVDSMKLKDYIRI